MYPAFGQANGIRFAREYATLNEPKTPVRGVPMAPARYPDQLEPRHSYTNP